MKISIITVSFNAESTIEDTIRSVIGQTYTDVEYIIIDGGSTDATLAIIDKYREQISLVVSEPDKGIYDGMNKGIARATGDYIGILNADDVYVDHSVIEEVVDVLSAEKTDTLYADLNYVQQDDLSKVVRVWKSGKFNHSSFLQGWMPPHPTFFVKKDCYNQYGNFNLQLKSAADYELILRMLYKNECSSSYLGRTIINMRVGGVSNSSIRNRIKANMEDRKAWELNNIRPKWYTLYMKPLSKLIQFLKK